MDTRNEVETGLFELGVGVFELQRSIFVDLNESYQYERIDIVIRTKLVQGTNFPVNLAIGTYYIE